mmetsp:Transcript_6680/g.7663  ORF Transcript_6680/g.7663 Transcript_6680/m.7663 type:complete len:398 (+) Transcript_6680:181-1374(+)
MAANSVKTKGRNKTYHRCLGRYFDSCEEAYKSLSPCKLNLKKRKTGDLCQKEHGVCLNKKSCYCTKTFQFYYCPFTKKWSLWDDESEQHSPECNAKSRSNDYLNQVLIKSEREASALERIESIQGHIPNIEEEWFGSRDIYLICRTYIMTEYRGLSWEKVINEVKAWVNSEKKRVAQEKLIPRIKRNIEQVSVLEDSDFSDIDFDSVLTAFEEKSESDGSGERDEADEFLDLLRVLDDNLKQTQKRKADVLSVTETVQAKSVKLVNMVISSDSDRPSLRRSFNVQARTGIHPQSCLMESRPIRKPAPSLGLQSQIYRTFTNLVINPDASRNVVAAKEKDNVEEETPMEMSVENSLISSFRSKLDLINKLEPKNNSEALRMLTNQRSEVLRAIKSLLK